MRMQGDEPSAKAWIRTQISMISCIIAPRAANWVVRHASSGLDYYFRRIEHVSDHDVQPCGRPSVSPAILRLIARFTEDCRLGHCLYWGFEVKYCVWRSIPHPARECLWVLYRRRLGGRTLSVGRCGLTCKVRNEVECPFNDLSREAVRAVE